MVVGDAHVFPGFLTPVVIQISFQSHPLLFSRFSRGERRKYTGKKFRLNRVLNSQSPGHESNTLTTEPPGQGENIVEKGENGSLFMWGFTPYQKYLSYLTVTVYKFMFPGLEYLTSPLS